MYLRTFETAEAHLNEKPQHQSHFQNIFKYWLRISVEITKLEAITIAVTALLLLKQHLQLQRKDLLKYDCVNVACFFF